MYNMAKALANTESKDVRFLEAGIHENVEIKGATKGETKNGNKFVEFTFEKEGKTMTHTEYEPKKWPGDSDEKFEQSCNTQALRILKILSVAYDNAVLGSFTASSFDGLIDWVISLINAMSKDLRVRLKVVYGDNGFTTLPRYTKYTFIENMNVEKDKSMIMELNVDKFTRPEQGDKEEIVKTPQSTLATSPF